jgi:hypothetical protein
MDEHLRQRSVEKKSCAARFGSSAMRQDDDQLPPDQEVFDEKNQLPEKKSQIGSTPCAVRMRSGLFLI